MDLSSYLKLFCPSEKDIACLFRKMVEGVVHMESYGVAHRDIKLENIMISIETQIDKNGEQ